jgi:outer membrane protein TolC
MKATITAVALCLAAAPALAQQSAGADSMAAPGPTAAPQPIVSGGQSPLAGGLPDKAPQPGVLKLTLADTISRALERNMAVVLSQQNVETARGEQWLARSGVLPDLNATLRESRQTLNLASFGLTLPDIPPLVPPFNVFDARIGVSQTIFDVSAFDHARAGSENLAAAKHSLNDVRNLVVLAATNMYLQVLAASSRLETAQAQLQTAEALTTQAEDLKKSGIVAGIDLLRAQVQAGAERQRLIIARNDLERQRLALARAIGLAPGQQFELAEPMTYQPAQPLGLDTALQQAISSREDIKSAEARLRALQQERNAAAMSRLPAVRVAADYGAIGNSVSSALNTYTIVGLVQVPLFDAGREQGRRAQAEAALRRQQAAVEDLRAQAGYEIRLAFLDVSAADERVRVAKEAMDLATQQLQQARDRFTAGVGDNIAVIQAQEALASASENYIGSLYAHNLAKAALARALGTGAPAAGPSSGVK